jgi:hypothetical protein
MMEASDRTVEYEPSDAEPRVIAWLGIGIIVLLLLSPVGLRLLFPDALDRGVNAGALANIPSPRLQIDPEHDLAALRDTEGGRLSSYGWINREQKAVRMPIERAMSVTLERGLPGWRKQ